MRRLLTRVIAMTVVVAGCSTAGTPATAPSTPSTSSVVSTTAPVSSTTSSSTTTTVAVTTTTIDRKAEIEAIFQDLENRRLQALYDGDREAFQALFANEEYMQQSMVLFDLVEFVDGWTAPKLTVEQVLADDPGCIAARVRGDYSRVFVDGDLGESARVVERDATGWGISYVGDGWACEGPHPLSG